MGRLIDADILSEEIYSWGMNDYEPSDFTDAIDDAPTVDAIPKADYEARLKADLEAILKELQLECEENTVRWYVGRVDGKSDDVVLIDTLNEIIEQKINALKEN